MRKYIIIALVILILVGGVIVGLILVQQNQIFKQKASTPTGVASVSIQPSQATFQRDVANPVSVYFNTKGISVSDVKVTLTFSNLGVTASGISIAQDFLSSGDWTCPVKTVTSTGSTGQVDISCHNTSDTGYSNNSDTLLGTFNLTASQVPIQNPLIVGFDPTNTTITQKSNGTDIALTPSSTGSYTITEAVAGSPTASPLLVLASTTPTPTTTGTGAALATSTPLPTFTPIPTVTPTPTSTALLALASTTPIPTITPTLIPGQTNPPIPVTGFDTPTIIGIAGGGVLLLLAVFALVL